jgi:hypothetical protein
VAVSPIRAGLDLVRGSLALIALRAGLLVLAGLPALLVAIVGVAAGPARQPYFTEVQGRLPLFHLVRLVDELPGAVAGMAVLAVLLALLGEQVLVAGGLTWLDPDETTREGAGPWRAVLGRGWSWLGPMLRVLLLAALFAGAGLAALHHLVESLIEHGEVAGWTAHTLMVLLPLLRVLLGVLWLSFVGAWAFWCRVLMVADGRRRARSAWALVARVLRRRPFSSIVLYVVVTLLSQLVGGVVLAIWRQGPPTRLAGALCWSASWLLVLLLQAFLWHWLLRAARLLYAQSRFDDLRQRPDAPLGVAGWLRRMVRRRGPRRTQEHS